jgi:hypothetical protein
MLRFIGYGNTQPATAFYFSFWDFNIFIDIYCPINVGFNIATSANCNSIRKSHNGAGRIFISGSYFKNLQYRYLYCGNQQLISITSSCTVKANLTRPKADGVA